MKSVNRKKRVVIIIQARMGSMRFPGKMMALLNGIPLIEWVITRCKNSRQTCKVVLSTSDTAMDDVLVDKAEELSVDVDRGSEDDVLKRFASASQKYHADVVVRVCGDRPLIDPELIDLAINQYNLNKTDLVYNHIAGEGENWPRGFGVEVFSSEILYWMDNSLDSPYYREHVTPYIWESMDKFTVSPVECPVDIDPKINNLRFDVDMFEDLEVLKCLCRNFDLNVGVRQVISEWKRGYRDEITMRVV